VDLVNAVAIIRKSNYVSLSKVASIHRGPYGRFERHRVEIGILKVLFPRHTNKVQFISPLNLLLAMATVSELNSIISPVCCLETCFFSLSQLFDALP